MAYVPKLSSEILADLRGGVIGRTELSDINLSSSLHSMLASFAEEMAGAERRLYALREQFFLEGASGSDLDERVSELPPLGITRISRSNASASCMRLSRDGTSGNLLIPRGSVVISDDGVSYSTTQDVYIGAGDSEVDNVPIICQSAGVVGNKGVGRINRVQSMPAEIISVVNTQALTNGSDEESDTQLRERAYLYLKSLGRTLPQSIEFMARSFLGSRNDRFPYARLFEDMTNLGYSELVVDDGSGISIPAVSRAGVQSSGLIPSGGSTIMWHEAPATEAIAPSSIVIWRNGNPNTQYGVTAADYVSIPERGMLYFKENILQAGDVWFVNGYNVFNGLIAELQKEIEGNPDDPTRITGFRPAGTRIRVIPVTPQFITMDISLIVDTSFDFKVIENRCVDIISAFVNNLAPGQPLFISQLVDACIGLTGLLDIRFYERDSDTTKANIIPLNPRTALRVNESSVKITTSAR
jgi:hypothetical protein